ncbi:hypothetical protein INR49_009744 [Caranx melampygus]|nr:hypothetical protein INR49_009744 [Caranx melampygus]
MLTRLCGVTEVLRHLLCDFWGKLILTAVSLVNQRHSFCVFNAEYCQAQFSGLVDKWMDCPLPRRAGASAGLREERETKEDDSHYWRRESQSPLISQWKYHSRPHSCVCPGAPPLTAPSCLRSNTTHRQCVLSPLTLSVY